MLPDTILSFPDAERLSWDECQLLVIPQLDTICGKFYETDIIHNNHIHFNINASIAEDTMFLYEYLLYCSSIRFISNVLYNYCKREQSATTRFHLDFANSISQLHQTQKKFFVRLLSRRQPQLFLQIMHSLAIYHFGLVTSYYIQSPACSIKVKMNICRQACKLYRQDYYQEVSSDKLSAYLQNWIKHYGYYFRNRHWFLYFLKMHVVTMVKRFRKLH